MLASKGTQGVKSAPAAVALSTAAGLALAANPARVCCWLSNNSAIAVYVGKDATVTAANGIEVPPNTVFRDDMTSDAWYAIAASATPSLGVLEVTTSY